MAAVTCILKVVVVFVQDRGCLYSVYIHDYSKGTVEKWPCRCMYGCSCIIQISAVVWCDCHVTLLIPCMAPGCMGDTQFHFRIRCTGSGTGGTDLRPSNHHYGAPLVLMVHTCTCRCTYIYHVGKSSCY